MSTITPTVKRRRARPDTPPAAALYPAAWAWMHTNNVRAHTAGLAARGKRGARAPEGQPWGPDGGYWWNEGYHGRPFAPLTDPIALHRVQQGARPQSPPAEPARRHGAPGVRPDTCPPHR
jgi:hypothetical protein